MRLPHFHVPPPQVSGVRKDSGEVEQDMVGGTREGGDGRQAKEMGGRRRPWPRAALEERVRVCGNGMTAAA
jgi:hypothetical protein